MRQIGFVTTAEIKIKAKRYYLNPAVLPNHFKLLIMGDNIIVHTEIPSIRIIRLVVQVLQRKASKEMKVCFLIFVYTQLKSLIIISIPQLNFQFGLNLFSGIISAVTVVVALGQIGLIVASVHLMKNTKKPSSCPPCYQISPTNIEEFQTCAKMKEKTYNSDP